MKRLMIPLLLMASASAAAEQMRHFMHHGYFYGLQADALEYRYGDSGEELGYWSTEAWWGTDELKALWLSEAEYSFDHDSWEALDNRLALQTPVSDFIDLRGGLRFDTPDGENRQYAFVGLNGLLPYWLEMDSNLYVNEYGDVSLDLALEYELLLTNRLHLTPELELDAAFSDDEAVGVGRGLSGMEAGLRLSYDLVDRSIVPYVGVHYERAFGRTADFAADEGEDRDGWFAVTGVRLMF